MRPRTAVTAGLRRRNPQGGAIYRHLRVARSVPSERQRPATAGRPSVACPQRAESRVSRPGRSTRGRFLVVGTTLGVLVLLPLVLIAGVVALIGSLAINASGRIPAGASRRHRSDVAAVVALAGTEADFSLRRVA